LTPSNADSSLQWIHLAKPFCGDFGIGIDIVEESVVSFDGGVGKGLILSVNVL
jgi:hypothetical protein